MQVVQKLTASVPCAIVISTDKDEIGLTNWTNNI